LRKRFWLWAMIGEWWCSTSSPANLIWKARRGSCAISAHGSRAAVIIAHRLSTVRDIADRIVVVHNGVIVEEGSHRELMSRNGWYAKMTRLQANGFDGHLLSAARSA